MSARTAAASASAVPSTQGMHQTLHLGHARERSRGGEVVGRIGVSSPRLSSRCWASSSATRPAARAMARGSGGGAGLRKQGLQVVPGLIGIAARTTGRLERVGGVRHDRQELVEGLRQFLRSLAEVPRRGLLGQVRTDVKHPDAAPVRPSGAPGCSGRPADMGPRQGGRLPERRGGESGARRAPEPLRTNPVASSLPPRLEEKNISSHRPMKPWTGRSSLQSRCHERPPRNSSAIHRSPSPPARETIQIISARLAMFNPQIFFSGCARIAPLSRNGSRSAFYCVGYTLRDLHR